MKVTFKTGSEANYGSTNGELFFASNTKQIMLNGIKYIPKKLSELTNDSGFISSITKSMVEGVLTGNITSHTHTFASLESKPATLSGYGITDAMYFYTTDEANYVAARFNNTALATKAANAYIEFWSGGGWFNLMAGKFITNGGTSSQFLKGDGSLDSNTYALSSALNNYLPLTGGTLTGNLTCNGSYITMSGGAGAKGYSGYFNNPKRSDRASYSHILGDGYAYGTNSISIGASAYAGIRNTDSDSDTYPYLHWQWMDCLQVKEVTSAGDVNCYGAILNNLGGTKDTAKFTVCVDGVCKFYDESKGEDDPTNQFLKFTNTDANFGRVVVFIVDNDATYNKGLIFGGTTEHPRRICSLKIGNMILGSGSRIADIASTTINKKTVYRLAIYWWSANLPASYDITKTTTAMICTKVNSSSYNGASSYASGSYSVASGNYSVASGYSSVASGDSSVAKHEGSKVYALRGISGANYQTVLGRDNIETTGAVVVGWGSSDASRKNIFVLDTNGNATFGSGGDGTVTAATFNGNLNGNAANASALSSHTIYELTYARIYTGGLRPNYGILVQTNIAVNSNTMVNAHIWGNGYSAKTPINTYIQFYNYNEGNEIINYACDHYGLNLGNVYAFNYSGNVCFWFDASKWAFQTIYVFVGTQNFDGMYNHVASLDNVVKPTEGVTREVTITPRVNAFLDSNVESATKLATARTIKVGSASKSFDGSGDIEFTLNSIITQSDTINVGVLNVAEQTTTKNITIGNHLSISSGVDIEGLTPSMIGAAEASHNHTFASLTSKPTTLSGYGITDAYTKTETNTELGKYLPLTGGTLTGALTVPNIYINGTSSVLPSHYFHNLYSGTDVYEHFGLDDRNIVTYGNFRFYNGKGGYKTLRIGGDGTFKWEGVDVSLSGHTHSYLPLSGGTMSNTSLVTNLNADLLDGYHASSFYTLKSIRSDQNSIYDLRYNYGTYNKGNYNGAYKDEYPTNYGAYLALAYEDKNMGALMFFDAPMSNVLGHIYVRTRGAGDKNTTYSEWGKLAYLTDNVASATKLESARTLWGQSFNGTANIDGSITLSTSATAVEISRGMRETSSSGFIGFSYKNKATGDEFNGISLGWGANPETSGASVRINSSTFTYKGNSVLHSGNLGYTSSGLSRAVQKDTNGNLFIVAPSLFEQGISNNYPKNLRWSNEAEGQLVYDTEIEAGNFDTVEIGIPLADGTSKGFLKSTSTVTNVTGYTPCPVVSGTPYYKLDAIELDYTDLGIVSGGIESNVPINTTIQQDGNLGYLLNYTVDNIPRLLTIALGSYCKYFFWLQQTDDDTPIVAYYHCQFNNLWLVIDSPNMEVRISQGTF